jgi:DNA replication protein DnaC
MTTTTAITKPCSDCRVPVVVEIPDDVMGMWRTKLEELPVRCDIHEAEAEARYVEEEGREESARIAQLVHQRERDCGLPSELRRLAWEPRETAAVKAAKRWAAGELPGLLLIGAVGRGKTWLAATAAWHRLGVEPIRWTLGSDLVAMIDAGFGSTERSQALNIVRSARGLVLDDLDKVRPTAAVAEMMLLAIDKRITAGRPLLVTTNCEPSELAKHFVEPYGDAIVSRLRGYCRAYRLGGDDRRVQL